MVRFWLIASVSTVLIGVSLAGCANQPPQENQDVAAPKKKEETGGEPTSPVEERAVLTGVVTEVDRESSRESGSVRSILVEEPPGANCGKGPTDPGCEKIYFEITDETRVLREEESGEVEVSAGDLKKGQRVRADYTGYPVAESYPAQTTARTVVIVEPVRSSPASGMLFPRQQGAGDVLMSEARGKLVLDEEGCLRVVGDETLVPIWPSDFRVDRGEFGSSTAGTESSRGSGRGCTWAEAGSPRRISKTSAG
jgi:hypothetical protein